MKLPQKSAERIQIVRWNSLPASQQNARLSDTKAGNTCKSLSSSENEPQPELQDSSRVPICSRGDRAKGREIANITVGSAKDHSIEKIESLSSELKFPFFTPHWESTEHREVDVPV